MDVEAALLAAIADRPGDDTPRLAYADWLDDHAGDQPDPTAVRARAEFIRVQIAVKQLEYLPSAEMQGYADLYRRQDALLTHHRRALLGPLSDALGPHDVVFDRGFVTELQMPDTAFVPHAAEIASWIPRPEVAVAAAVPRRAFLESPYLALVTAVRWTRLLTFDAIPWPTWDNLRLLNLSGCVLEDVGLVSFVSARHSYYPVLTDLDLSWNNLSDDGVRSLVESPLWPQLRVLVVGGNPLSDAAATILSVARPTSLKYLNIAQTGITTAGRNQLLGREVRKVDLF